MNKPKLSYIHEIRSKSKKIDTKDVSVILMCASNYKMKSLGPKPMLKIYGNISLLDYQINTINKVINQADIFLCIGEDSERLINNKPANVRIIENQMYHNTNEVEYIRLAINAITTDKVIIIDGSMLFDVDHIKYLYNQNTSSIIYDSKNRLNDSNIGVTVVDGKATNFAYKLQHKWANMLSLAGEDLQFFRRLVNNRTKRTQFIFECLNTMLNKKLFDASEVGGQLIKVDSTKILENIQ